MNKTELIAAIAEEAGLSKKDAEKALKAFTDVVAAQMKKGEKVQIVGFGTFEVSERSEREGRNPQTGEPMTIAASRTPKFKAGKALKTPSTEFTRQLLSAAAFFCGGEAVRRDPGVWGPSAFSAVKGPRVPAHTPGAGRK